MTEVYDVGFLPYFHDVHNDFYTSNFEYSCLGDEYRNDQNYETDDRFACDRALQESLKKENDYKNEWAGLKGGRHDFMSHISKDSDCY